MRGIRMNGLGCNEASFDYCTDSFVVFICVDDLMRKYIPLYLKE